MSKKSRKRNKKILAAIGIGLGAAALASRKNKSDLASTEDGKSGSTKITGGTNSNDYDSGTKKDTAKKSDSMPSNLSKNTGKDNKPKDTKPETVRMTSANVQSGKIDAPYKGLFTSGVAKRQAENAKFNADIRKKRNPAVTGTTLPGQSLRSGGRAGLRSGGRVKGCGKALRGFGKAMKGKR